MKDFTSFYLLLLVVFRLRYFFAAKVFFSSYREDIIYLHSLYTYIYWYCVSNQIFTF